MKTLHIQNRSISHEVVEGIRKTVEDSLVSAIPMLKVLPDLVGSVTISVNAEIPFLGGRGECTLVDTEFSLSRRLTRKFVLGWAGEDEWSHHGTGRVIITRTQWDDEGETLTQNLLVTVDTNLRDANIESCLHDSLSESSCRCEHDCCGCIAMRVDEAKKATDGVWTVKTSGGRNI